ISKRENVLLTQLFTSLNKSGQGVALTKQVTTSSLTQGSAIQIIIDYLKGANLTTILEAADNSGLALDIVLLTLTDYDVLPGIVKVIEGVFENSNSTSSSGGLVSSIIGGILDTLGLEITSVAGTDETVNDVCTSLEKSGLGVSVVKQLFTDEDEYDFDIKLVSDIIDEKVITLDDLLTALKQSHLIAHIISDILGNFSYIKLVISFVI
ncbi:hypothetical protein HYPBUDRAFT_130464, partial [Hyphopichia burtonii NRRL Y-1933]